MEDSQTHIPSDITVKSTTMEPQQERQQASSRLGWKEMFSQKWNRARERITGKAGGLSVDSASGVARDVNSGAKSETGSSGTSITTASTATINSTTGAPFAFERQDPLAAHIEEKEQRERRSKLLNTETIQTDATGTTAHISKRYQQPGVPTPFANIPGTREVISKPPFNPNEKVVYKVVTFNPRQPAHILDPEGVVDLETLREQERAKGPKTDVWVREVMPRGY